MNNDRERARSSQTFVFHSNSASLSSRPSHMQSICHHTIYRRRLCIRPHIIIRAPLTYGQYCRVLRVETRIITNTILYRWSTHARIVRCVGDWRVRPKVLISYYVRWVVNAKLFVLPPPNGRHRTSRTWCIWRVSRLWANTRSTLLPARAHASGNWCVFAASIVYANMCCLCGRCRVPLVAQHTDTDCALSASNPRHKFVRRKYDYLFKASFAYLCVNVWVCENMSRCYLTRYSRTHRRSIVIHMYTYTIHPVYKDDAILRSLLICSVVDVAVYKVGSPSVWFRDIVSKIFDWHLRYSAWIRERNA